MNGNYPDPDDRLPPCPQCKQVWHAPNISCDLARRLSDDSAKCDRAWREYQDKN